jgi:lipopolysaccharide/colanic/teichoic acid biosynthesis glycosyltransferase
MRQEGVYLAAKRAIDKTLAGALLVTLSPVMAATALAVRVSMGSPVLFRQRRPGLHGRPFELVKFRTMTDARDAAGAPLPDGRRLTRVGQFIRSTSLDELPQLWNVMRGEMSLVGPRPLLMEYLSRYTSEQARRHDVLPGITGWTAINGRNALQWETKFALDVWYVDHWSLWLDAKILALTAARLVDRSGISQEGYATMPVFMGTEAGRDPEGLK